MPRIQLQLYTDPGAAEVFINFQRMDGTFRRFAGTVDTGAEVSLVPRVFMDELAFRLTEHSQIVVDQAGIAGQSFEAIEAFLTIFLEDQTGEQTKPFQVKVWFAETDEILIGFDGLLDQSVLHLDMRQRQGWIDLDP